MANAETDADLDQCVLQALSKRMELMTYVIRNTLVMGHLTRKWPSSLCTPLILRSCRRLERRGHVEEVATFYAVQKCWAITDAGHAALDSMEKGQ